MSDPDGRASPGRAAAGQRTAAAAVRPEQAGPRPPRRVKDRLISAELARLRTRAGKKAGQVARHMGWSASKVSRIEHGLTPIDGAALPRLLDFLGATREETTTIIGLAAAGTPAGDYGNAQAVLDWATTVLPPALRSPGYAWAVETAHADLTRQPPGTAEAAVAAALRWQDLAATGSLRIHAVFDEPGLARQYGTAQVMAAQAAHMAGLAARPNITVQMIPLAAAGVPAVSSFTYIQFAAELGLSAADTVLLRQLHGDGRLDASRDTYLYRYAFTQLTALAASQHDTLTAIGHAQQRWATQASRSRPASSPGPAAGR